MTDFDSLTKARYVLSLIKVAQRADRDQAARLLDGLTTEYPHQDTVAEIADAHRRTVGAIEMLARAVRDNSSTEKMWASALGAAETWRRLANRQGAND